MRPLSTTGNPMTEAEYLAFERDSTFKHEYRNGAVFAAHGANQRHNLIAGGTLSALYWQIRGRICQVYASLMRIKVQATGLYTYADFSVVCGEVQVEDEFDDTILNPTVIIEILSPSTETYDRGEKFQHYQKLESLQEYVLISQDSPRIERYMRQGHDSWMLAEAQGLDASIELTSIGCTLKLAEVYEQITFEDTAS